MADHCFVAADRCFVKGWRREVPVDIAKIQQAKFSQTFFFFSDSAFMRVVLSALFQNAFNLCPTHCFTFQSARRRIKVIGCDSKWWLKGEVLQSAEKKPVTLRLVPALLGLGLSGARLKTGVVFN